MKLDRPFVAGQISRGHITYPGYEHLKWEAVVQSLEPEHLFSFTWHPYAVDPKVDYSLEPSTLVEFRLQKTSTEHCYYFRNPASTRFPWSDVSRHSVGMMACGRADEEH